MQTLKEIKGDKVFCGEIRWGVEQGVLIVIYFENKERGIKEQKEDESEAKLIHIKREGEIPES